jgi:hypothetical protein
MLLDLKVRKHKLLKMINKLQEKLTQSQKRREKLKNLWAKQQKKHNKMKKIKSTMKSYTDLMVKDWTLVTMNSLPLLHTRVDPLTEVITLDGSIKVETIGCALMMIL